MRYRLICLVFSLFFLPAVGTAGTSALQAGFADLMWGQQLTDLAHYKKVWAKGNVSFYANAGERYTLYGIEIPQVVYGFSDERFFAVYATLASPELFARLKRSLSDKYGDPATTFSTKSAQKVFKWKTGKIKIKLKQNQETGKMKLALYYTPISRKLNESQYEQMSDGAFRLFPLKKTDQRHAFPILDF